jgi:hypothetical protein
MPIVPPLLDDRSWQDLRDEALARVPIYTPEWTDLRPGDPGVTLVEVFAFLTEALIYRLNRVPDNSYLAFLNLLDAPPLPAEAAYGVVQFAPKGVGRLLVNQGSRVSAGKVPFVTEDSLTVLPVDLAGYLKCRVQAPKAKSDAGAFAASAFKAFQDAQADQAKPFTAIPHVSKAYPPPDGSRLALSRAMDGTLWIAVMLRAEDAAAASTPAELDTLKTQVRTQLGGQYLAIGMAPFAGGRRECKACAAPVDTGGNRAVDTAETSRWRFEITAPEGITGFPTALGWDHQPRYAPLLVASDTTDGLREPGVVKVQLPPYNPPPPGKKPKAPEQTLSTWELVQPKPGIIGPASPVPIAAYPRAGDLPPLLDDGELERRLVFWIRALPRDSKPGDTPPKRGSAQDALAWLGPNAVDVVQALKQNREVVGVGTGQPGQQLRLGLTPILAGSLDLSVEEDGVASTWREVTSFDAAGERDGVYLLDRALGLVTVGDGLRGRVLPDGVRVIASYRYGGGLAGNQPAGALAKLDAAPVPIDPGVDLDRGKTLNPVATRGGSETETVDQARRRVPMILRHQNRAVTAEDFRELAALTPGVAVGRVEVLPLYRPCMPPAQKWPGVVTVLVVPAEDALHPRAPEPDAAFRQAVCKHLDRHRLITTELHITGPRYIRIAVSVGVKAKTGVGIEDLNNWICLALHQYFAPLPPFGPDGKGWPLGGKINRAAIEAAVLQVDGVAWVEDLHLYRIYGDGSVVETELIELGMIDLPELTDVRTGPTAPPLASCPPASDKIPVPVPVPRRSC